MSKKLSDLYNKTKALLSKKITAKREIIKIDTLIGKKTTVDGDFTVIGNCKIDGRINGTIKVSGDLVVGETAQIEGSISADNIIVAGIIVGDITAKGQLCVKKEANIKGEHTAYSLAAEEGCVFVGNCKILEQEV
ncbi:MAG: polymer-forming cytoskeletal protein [Clostridiaceae bacterium]|jgi:cytoskeletal protein CcmA (bactofilin family)|nr:polymer-forming cytoskeletal protein [Clostridiaceae bacterium]